MATSALFRRVIDLRAGLVYEMLPQEWRPVTPRTAEGDVIEVHRNRVEDLLLWSGSALSTASAITECARNYSRCRATGRDFHTILLNGQLAGWGYSYFPEEPAQLTETPGVELNFPPNSVSLYDFHVIPTFRGRRLYQHLLSEILRQRFAEGAKQAYIGVLDSNSPSREAIVRVGFRLVARNRYRQVFGRSSIATERFTAHSLVTTAGVRK
jgi:ribosomal protein S18 acetylase RimI-like enzyme